MTWIPTKDACVGCGYCCLKALCFEAVRLHGSDTKRCPELWWNGLKYRCLLMRGNSHKALKYRTILASGEGCCSGYNSWRKEVKERG